MGLGTIFKTGDDLNNYTTPGRYYSNSAAISGSLLHCPYTSGGFTLDVSYNASSAYLWQKIRSRGSGAVCYRTCSDSTWNDWKTVLTNADIASKSTNLTPGGGYTVLSWFGCFAVISGGSCYLQIGLTSTTPTIASSKSIICTLPTQYRPVRKYIQHTDWGDFVVDTDGTIYIGNTTSSLLHNKNITINAAFLT